MILSEKKARQKLEELFTKGLQISIDEGKLKQDVVAAEKLVESSLNFVKAASENMPALKIRKSLPTVIKYVRSINKMGSLLNDKDITVNCSIITEYLVDIYSRLKSGNIKTIGELRYEIGKVIPKLKAISFEQQTIDKITQSLKFLKGRKTITLPRTKDPVSTTEGSILFELNSGVNNKLIHRMESFFKIERNLNYILIPTTKLLVVSENKALHRVMHTNDKKIGTKEQVNVICQVISNRARVSIVPVHEVAKKSNGFYIVWTIPDKYAKTVSVFNSQVRDFQIYVTVSSS